MSVVNKKTNSDDFIKKLFAAGAHFGYSKSRNHPSTKEVIYGYKNNGAIINLEQTIAGLEKAAAYLEGLGMTGKKILLVGTKPESKLAVERAAEVLGVPYVTSRWLGGTFTNFPQIKSRIDRLAELKEKKETGGLDVYTKKERLIIDREIARLERYLSSLSRLAELPTAVIVVDSRHDAIVVKEALKTGVRVIGLANTDCDLDALDYPVVLNDSSTSAIRLVIEFLAEAYRRGVSAPKPEIAATPSSTVV